MGIKYELVRPFISALAPAVTTAHAVRRVRHGLGRPTTRGEFLQRIGNRRTKLEIGPFYNPLLRGEGVHYFDVLNRDQLITRAVSWGFDPAGCPDIHYVSPTGDMGIINARFDAVLGSHGIEHQPDIVGHLQHIERILTDGGTYFMIVPDKRYCFDHFNPPSVLADVLAARGRTVHTNIALNRHYMNQTHNRAWKHWLGYHGAHPERRINGDAPVLAREDMERCASGEYVDVHGWWFTPEGLRSVLNGLSALGLTKMRLQRIHDTKFGEQEFFAEMVLAD